MTFDYYWLIVTELLHFHLSMCMVYTLSQTLKSWNSDIANINSKNSKLY